MMLQDTFFVSNLWRVKQNGMLFVSSYGLFEFAEQ